METGLEALAGGTGLEALAGGRGTSPAKASSPKSLVRLGFSHYSLFIIHI